MTQPDPENGNGAAPTVHLEPAIQPPEIRPGAYAWTVRGPSGDEFVTSDAKDTAGFFAAHIKGREAVVTPDAIVIPGSEAIVVRPGWVTDESDDDDDEDDDEDRGNRAEAPRGGAGKAW